MKKVLVALGTRPEAVKLAPVFFKLKEADDLFETRMCITGQHREMLDQILTFFSITPDYDLNVMKQNQSLNSVLSSVVNGIDQIIFKWKPDLLLVQGDTTTTFATALAGFYRNIAVGHVEAGLRTYDLTAPYPEEANRQLTSRISNYHFAPTDVNQEILLKEGGDPGSIFITGNPVIDALVHTKAKILGPSFKIASENFNEVERLISKYEKMILITGHRRENFGKGFLNICEALTKLSLAYPEILFIYPVHLNPNVQKPVFDILSDLKNVHLIEPVEYPFFVYLMDKSYIILTDSGGVQEEAPSLGKPVLVMREKTERGEALTAGTIKLVGTDGDKIFNEAKRLIEDKEEYAAMASRENPYGDGRASEKIVNILREVL